MKKRTGMICIERIGMDRPCGLARRRRLPTYPPPGGGSQLDEESGTPFRTFPRYNLIEVFERLNLITVCVFR